MVDENPGYIIRRKPSWKKEFSVDQPLLSLIPPDEISDDYTDANSNPGMVLSSFMEHVISSPLAEKMKDMVGGNCSPNGARSSSRNIDAKASHKTNLKGSQKDSQKSSQKSSNSPRDETSPRKTPGGKMSPLGLRSGLTLKQVCYFH
jgi:hypothetical protein